jgi:glycosyltransferase involved in cell wall biosynthesis
MPTVSVVIPTYNRALMLKEAIQSVLDQTYSDYEIIVVDDGSTDNTREVVNGFSDKRIIYVFQENRGRSNARNRGISLAQGRYVAFLDADDLFLPTKLEKQVFFMENNPGIVFSHTSYIRVNVKGEHIEEVKSGTFSGKVYPEIIRGCSIATPTVMIDREVLDKNLRFNETLQVGEDVILWTQLARKSTFIGILEPLSEVRIHGKNAALDPYVQITSSINTIELLINSDPTLSFWIRHRLLSDIYLSISWNYLLTREKTKAPKFLMLAFLNQPLNPFFHIVCKLSSLLRLEPIARFRGIHAILKASARH